MSHEPDNLLLWLEREVTEARLARTTDPHTSKEAAASASKRGPTQRRRVWNTLNNLGNATDFEISVTLGILRSSASKRRQELSDLGFIIDTGLRRNTDSGSSAIVWRPCSSLDQVALEQAMTRSSTIRRSTSSMLSPSVKRDGARVNSLDGQGTQQTMKAVWAYIEQHGTTTPQEIHAYRVAAETRRSLSRLRSRFVSPESDGTTRRDESSSSPSAGMAGDA